MEAQVKVDQGMLSNQGEDGIITMTLVVVGVVVEGEGDNEGGGEEADSHLQ